MKSSMFIVYRAQTIGKWQLAMPYTYTKYNIIIKKNHSQIMEIDGKVKGGKKKRNKLTAIDIQFSSWVFGNFTITFDPAFSSLSFSGRKRHTTLMLSSAAISRSADIFNYHTLNYSTFSLAQNNIYSILFLFQYFLLPFA